MCIVSTHVLLFAKIISPAVQQSQSKSIFVKSGSERVEKTRRRKKPKEVGMMELRPEHHQEHGTQNLEPESLQVI